MFRSLAEDYRHLEQQVQRWDVSCERQVEIRGRDAARLVQRMTPRDLSRAVPGRCLYAPPPAARFAMNGIAFTAGHLHRSTSRSSPLVWAAPRGVVK